MPFLPRRGYLLLTELLMSYRTVQKTGCLKVILERTMASVPDWSEMRHSALLVTKNKMGYFGV